MAQATRKSRHTLAAVNGFGLEALAEENAQLAINRSTGMAEPIMISVLNGDFLH
jgi:hypothetical protein